MNIPENAGTGSSLGAPTAMSGTRSMYWSVRREVWENRSIYLAPLAAAAVNLSGFAISTLCLPEGRRATLLLNPARQRIYIEKPYDIAAMIMMLTAIIVGLFYCLDALHGERRDRSILFWKSLPVSDFTTVLSKLSIPLLVLPLIVFVVTVCTHLLMLLLSTAVLLLNGIKPASWTQLPLLQVWEVMLYCLAAMGLWYAPIYGWLLLASGWARRTVLLWAMLPLLAIGAFEKIAFQTSHFSTFLKHRCMKWHQEAFIFTRHGAYAMEPWTQLTLRKFLSAPGLWVGLALAVVFLAIAVRLRRSRGPL